MSVSNCARLVQKYKWHWNKKSLSLSGSVLLKMLGMWALVPLVLVFRLGVWLELRVLASWLSTSANCSLVLLLQWGFDYKQVKDVGLLAVIVLVVGLVAGASSQLGLLSAELILGPSTGETVWSGWIILEGDLRDEWPLWWIRLECHGAFGR